jgi:hypothetical protein
MVWASPEVLVSRTPAALAALLALASFSGAAQAGPLNPWGAAIGEGVVGVNPFLYVYSGPGVLPILYGQYGFSDSADIIVGGGAWLAKGESGFDTLEVMPRFFFTENLGVAVHALVPGSFDSAEVGPELHGYWSTDSLDLTVNAGWRPSFGGGGFGLGGPFAMVAPERYLNDTWSVYVELDGAYDLTEGLPSDSRLSAMVVPGVSAGFAETHYLSLGLQVPVVPAPTAEALSVGMWYATSFGGE